MQNETGFNKGRKSPSVFLLLNEKGKNKRKKKKGIRENQIIGFGFFVIPHLAGLLHEIPITSRWSFLFTETLLFF